MERQEVLQALGLAPGDSAFADGWDQAAAEVPSGAAAWLRRETIESACQAACLTAEMTLAIIAMGKRAAAEAALAALAWYCHHAMFRRRLDDDAIERWPVEIPSLGQETGLFYALILLSGTPGMQAIHRDRGIPLPVVRDTVGDLALWMRSDCYFTRHQRWGISPPRLSWLRCHWDGRLYRLGRLQFVPGRFGHNLCAFRHRQAGTVVSLAGEGTRVRGDGLLDGSDGLSDPNAWATAFQDTGREWIGHMIAPTGRVLPRQLTLPADQWQQVLSRGDPILEIHIPAGSPMDFDSCGDSFRQAAEFFPRDFPDRPFHAFTCVSWTLDPSFETILPATSNLVLFQKEVYLFPTGGGRRGMLRRVFGSDTADPAGLPRDTTLRRAILRHLDSGGHLCGGGCFLFPQDLHWGAQFYRSQNLKGIQQSDV